MKTITAEKIFTKEVPAASDGRYKAFTAYSALYNDHWYNLRGKADNIKEGDELVGEIIDTKKYTNKNDEEKTAYTFKLLSPEVASLVKRVSELEKVVFPDGKVPGIGKEDLPDKDVMDITDDDIPI